MKRQNKFSLSDRELAQLQWNFIQSMPKHYWTEMDVNEFYLKELRSRYQKATVFWPALGDRLLPEQIKELQWELQSDVKTVFIPINTGSHWNFVVLEKNPRRKNDAISQEWVVKKVETPADGLCGKHTVTQSMQVLDQGLQIYSANNPHRVRELSASDPIRVQIHQALLINTDNGSSTGNSQFERDIQVATVESFKIKYLSAFDLKLAKLAEYEQLGYSIETLCQELSQMLVDMSSFARNAAIDRLLNSSKLAQKPSIAKVIAGCHQKLAKVSANPHLLFPRPKPSSTRANKILDEDQNYCRASLA